MQVSPPSAAYPTTPSAATSGAGGWYAGPGRVCEKKPYPVQYYPVQNYGTKRIEPLNMIDLCILAPETLPGLLKSQQHLVTDKGFNGQTLLHRAVLSATPEAIKILLDHGADPNSRNNHNETPTLFACRRGHPAVLHTLVSRGGRLDVNDNSGKGPVHHAAHGGAVTGLHYLSFVHGLSLRTLDRDGNSPLHICCTHGHPDATSYLLKYERSDVCQTNCAGDSVLHLAAKMGHSAICWQIMEQGGLRLLHHPNQQGETPLDLAVQGTHQRYRTLQQVLEFYSKKTQSTFKGGGPPPSGPGWVWWLLLFLPFLLYALVLGASYCFYDYSGDIMIAGVIIILCVCVRQGHRIKHVSRLPNPMFMGMFGAGFAHTLLCFYIKLLPVLYLQSIPLTYFTLIYAALLIYMYYRLLTMDPGVVSESVRKPSGERYSMVDVANGSVPVEAFCKACETIPPTRTKHCKLCERCYVDMDHHCLFLYRCVARQNHRLFIRFILAVMFAEVLFEVFGWRDVFCMYPDPNGLWGLSFWAIFWKEPWVWSLMLANLISIFWGCTLLRYQLKVVSRGHTTYFQPNFGRTPLSRKQQLMNALYFLIGRRPYAFDPLMSKLQSFHTQDRL